jgi:hypothetical protein
MERIEMRKGSYSSGKYVCEGELENMRLRAAITQQVEGLALQELCRFYAEFKRYPSHEDRQWLANSYEQVSKLVTRPGITERMYWHYMRLGVLENTRQGSKIEQQVEGLARQEACRFDREFKNEEPGPEHREWLADSYAQVCKLVTRPGITKRMYWHYFRMCLAVMRDPDY